jgi:hypothetical protein
MTSTSIRRVTLYAGLSLAVAILLSACVNVTQLPAKPQLEFVDLTSFDRELNSALTAKLHDVNVTVVNNINATHIPERMQAWLHAVEAGGGTVTVSPPKSTVAAKNPILLLTVISGIWNGVKAAQALQSYEVHKSARTYDAEIVLKISEEGDRLIDKVIFTERKPT